MTKSCEYLLKLIDFPVLLCPMIVAPTGVEKGKGFAKGNLSFSPVFCVPEQIGVRRKARKVGTEPPFFLTLRKVLPQLFGLVEGSQPTQPLYGPFGFGETGSMLLTYLNCPDNVPPIVHHHSDSWSPLFRRSSREG